MRPNPHRVNCPELFTAIRQRDELSLLRLLESGKSPDSRDLKDEMEWLTLNTTALLKACACGWEYGVKVLLEFGAEVNERNSHGQNALYYAVIFPTAERERIVDMLIEAGIAFDCPEKSSELGFERGRTPLMVAASDNNLYAIKRLLKLGADLNRRDADGSNALFHAAYAGKLEALELLLDSGAEIDIVCEDIDTPLQTLVTHGNIAGVKLLLNRGANPNLRDISNTTALHCVVQKSIEPSFMSVDIIEPQYLSNNVNSIEFENRVTILKLLIAHGAELDPMDHRNQTPLMIALENGYDKLAKLLIEHGANTFHTTH